MAPTTIRKAIGAVKDQTSISLAKVAGNIAPDLEVLVVKATSHEDEPADEKYLREIISLMSHSQSYFAACVATVSKRLSKTRDWIVALKALILLHRLMADGDPRFAEELLYSTRRGMQILNLSDFRDEAHSNSWDHASFIRVYAMYLEEKVAFEALDKKSRPREREFEDDRLGYDSRARSYGDLGESSSGARDKKMPVREMKPENALSRLEKLLRILDRVLRCIPKGFAKNSRLVLLAVYLVLKESFVLYIEICDALSVLLDKFTELEHGDCVKCFDAYVNAAKMIEELNVFYSWCKDMGIARSSEYPQVEKITDELLSTLEGFLKETKNRLKSPVRINVENIKEEEEEEQQDMNEIKALPPPETATPPPRPLPQPAAFEQKTPNLQPKQPAAEDLVNLKDDAVSADEQGNGMALALFSGPATVKAEGSWEAFPSDGDNEVKSAWENPAAEIGRADWELALVESASSLAKQKNELGGGLDPLMLNGMYDHGTVNQYVNTGQLQGGSASSVALPGLEKTKTPLLALPAPDGTVKPVGPVDPFAASLSVPPPSYVQMAEMERKQEMLVHEQHAWQQYARDGMQGPVGLAKATGGSGNYYHYPPPPY